VPHLRVSVGGGQKLRPWLQLEAVWVPVGLGSELSGHIVGHGPGERDSQWATGRSRLGEELEREGRIASGNWAAVGWFAS